MTIKLYLSLALVAFSCGHSLPSGESVSDTFNSAAQNKPQTVVLPVLFIFNVDQLSQFPDSEYGNEDSEDESNLVQSARKEHRENSVVNTRRDVNARNNARVWEISKGKSNPDSNGFYDRFYGGSSGAGKSNFGEGLKFINHYHRQY